MDTQLQQQLADYLKLILETIKTGSTFVAGQVPLVVQEKITYGRAEETITLVILIVLVYLSYRTVRWGMDQNDEMSVVACVVGGIGILLFTVLALIELDFVLKVWFAPRLYIIEWIVSLLKDVKK